MGSFGVVLLARCCDSRGWRFVAMTVGFRVLGLFWWGDLFEIARMVVLVCSVWLSVGVFFRCFFCFGLRY